jgi:hypothetical protein
MLSAADRMSARREMPVPSGPARQLDKSMCADADREVRTRPACRRAATAPDRTPGPRRWRRTKDARVCTADDQRHPVTDAAGAASQRIKGRKVDGRAHDGRPVIEWSLRAHMTRPPPRLITRAPASARPAARQAPPHPRQETATSASSHAGFPAFAASTRGRDNGGCEPFDLAIRRPRAGPTMVPGRCCPGCGRDPGRARRDRRGRG